MRPTPLQLECRAITRIALLAILATSCRTPAEPTPRPTQIAPVSPVSRPAAAARPFTVPILMTTDEHGWMEPHPLDEGRRSEGGMPQLLGYWRGAYGYDPDKYLTISGGDAWTGPYESTVLQGSPVVEIMNLAGYDAQVVGNHDFDFGPEVLLQRAREARFPLLAANVYRVGASARPPFAVGNTTVRVDGARVGVVGLANIDTPVVTHPRNVAGLSFTEYEGALRREVAALRATGVDAVVVVIHHEVEGLLPLVPLFRELGVSFIGSGHSHMPSLTIDAGSLPGPEDDVILCNPGPYARSFCHARLSFDGAPPRLVDHEVEIVRIESTRAQPAYPPAEEVSAVIERARSQASTAGDEQLATTTHGLRRDDPDERLGHLVVDAWLDALPYVQVAITTPAD